MWLDVGRRLYYSYVGDGISKILEQKRVRARTNLTGFLLKAVATNVANMVTKESTVAAMDQKVRCPSPRMVRKGLSRESAITVVSLAT